MVPISFVCHSVIEQLKLSLKNRDAEVAQLQKAIASEGRESQPASAHTRDLTEAIAQKDQELEVRACPSAF